MQLKHLSPFLFTGIVLLQPVFAAPQAGQGQIKCWQNDDGVRECGNVIPPQYTQQGYKEVNSQGTTVRKIERAKTPEELAEEKRKQEAAQLAERNRKEQEEKDRALLLQFSKEDDIESDRKAKLNTIDAAMSSIDSYISSLNKNLKDLEKSLEESLKNPATPPAQITTTKRNIENVKQRIRTSQGTIENKQREKDEVNNRYDGYLKRYKEVLEEQTKQEKKAPATTKPGDKDNAPNETKRPEVIH